MVGSAEFLLSLATNADQWIWQDFLEMAEFFLRVQIIFVAFHSCYAHGMCFTLINEIASKNRLNYNSSTEH